MLSGSCRISQLPKNGWITYPFDPDRRLYPGNVVDANVAVVYQCVNNYLLVSPVDGILGANFTNFCIGGNWVKPIPNCESFCSTKAIHGVTFSAVECLYRKRSVSCTDPPRPGTVVRLSCADRYRNFNTNTQQTVTCTDAGQWSPFPQACSPICGEETPKGTPFIVNGEEAQITQAPWHVAIYKRNDVTNSLVIVCGGTILNARVVISAMHCFWYPALRRPYPASLYRVAAGKTYSDYTANEPFQQQFFGVKEILYVKDQKKGYQGEANDYLADIALLILEPHITFQATISPICLPLNLQNEERVVPPGWDGRVAGYGLTSSGGSVSSVLKIVDLPTVARDMCARETQLRLPNDKFCAGYLNMNVSVCMGDSGGGLVFPINDFGRKIFYLRGIVSTGVQNKVDYGCDSNKYATFTNILYYDSFLAENEASNRPEF